MKEINLKNLCHVFNGYAFKSENYTKRGVRIIRITNVKKGYIDDSEPKYYNLNKTDKLKNYLLKENDLLISLTGNVGRVGLVDKKILPAGLNQRVACLRAKDSEIIDINYLYQYLNNNKFENECIKNSKGVAQKNLSTEWIKKYIIKIPEIKEQKEITYKLKKVQDIILKKKDQIKELNEVIKSQFVEMFGDPILNEKNWDIKSLKDISNKICSGSTPKGGDRVYVKSGVEFYRSQNVWKNKIEQDDIAYIDEETHNLMRKTSLKHNDLLITKTGRINTENSSLGRTAIYEGKNDKANINGHVYLIRLNNKECHQYILRILISDQYREYIRGVCVGGIDKRQLNKKHIEEFPIIYPPIELQNQFAEFVKQIDKQKFEIEKSLKEMEELYESLMDKYFG